MGDSVLKPLFEKYEADIPQWKERYTRALHGERLRFESKIACRKYFNISREFLDNLLFQNNYINKFNAKFIIE